MIYYIHNVSGRVVELCPPYKAIVIIDPYLTGEGQRALLWSNKLSVDGKYSMAYENIGEYVSVNSKVTFTCHSLDDKLQDNCSWFIAVARRQHPSDLPMNDNFLFGIMHGLGQPFQLSPRQGVLEHVTAAGKAVLVLFQASKLFVYGSRVKAKQTLDEIVTTGNYAFDAVPVNPLDNEYGCLWMATVVWRGTKPIVNYDEVSIPPAVLSATKVPSLYAEIKTLVSDPRGVFWRGYGLIGKVLNDEFAVIYGRRQPNRHESVIFHRNFFSLFKVSMANKDLRKFLKPGIRVQFIAVPSSEKFMVQWIGFNVCVDRDGHLADEVNFMP